MRIEYYAAGRKRTLSVRAAHGVPAGGQPGPRARPSALLRAGAAPAPVRPGGEQTVLPTRTVAVGGARAGELRWLWRRFGLQVVEEGSHGKVLLEVPGPDDQAFGVAVQAALEVYERGAVRSAQPNFLRLLQRPGRSDVAATSQWGLTNRGEQGLVGADVAAVAAWTLTEGSPEVRVAVLDDGVERGHPYLAPAVVAERDFVDDDGAAAPAGDDTHGTACAGIVASRGDVVRGLAPGVSLVGCRIAARRPEGWLVDDFHIADAVDWCWRDARADVLSLSWAAGAPSDLLEEALERARGLGRSGRGSVVVVAAGNDQGPIRYPGNLPEVLTVGATNQWDERKTTTSRDGERHWGSNHGPGLDLVAPGVQILTTDVSAAAAPGLTTARFSGTSAATPFVAAAAALVLSVAPRLGEADVRDVLLASADRLGPRARDSFVGAGRLNVFRALRAAYRR